MPSTDAYEKRVLKSLFIGIQLDAFTPWLGLSTSTPTDAGGSITEPSGGAGYARIDIKNNADGSGNPAFTQATIDGSVGDAVPNDNDIIFPVASSSWGTVTHWVLFTAASGGTAYAYGAFSTPKTIAAGERLLIAAGQFQPTVS